MTDFLPQLWMCPICMDPLLDPVVADDCYMYDEKCFIEYNKNNNMMSPFTGKLVSQKYIKVFQIRSFVIDLMLSTDEFDQWLTDTSYDRIIDLNLSHHIIHSEKLQLLDQSIRINLIKYVVTKMFDSLEYENAIKLLNQYEIGSESMKTDHWIKLCENNRSEQALKFMDYFVSEIDYNFITDTGVNGLLMACKNKMIDVVLKLLEKPNLNLSFVDKKSNNALILCCERKLSDLALKILEKDRFGLYNHINSEGANALIIACNNRLEEVTIALLKKSDIDYNFVYDRCHIFILVCNIGTEQVIDEFLKKPDLKYNSICEKTGKNALLMCCHRKNENTAKKLITFADMDINHIDNEGNNAFYYACRQNMVDVATMMLGISRIPIDYNNAKKNNVGHTPLIEVCKKRCSDLAMQILNKPDTDIWSHTLSHKTTAFIMACKYGMIDVVKKMLEMKVDYNHVNALGNTALIYACKNKHSLIALLLLEIPDINYVTTNNRKETALKFARLNILNEVIHVLEERAKLSKINKKSIFLSFKYT